MRRLPVLLLLVFVSLSGCNRKQDRSIIHKVDDNLARPSAVSPSVVYFWEAVPETGLSGVVLQPSWIVRSDSVTVEGMMALLNGRYPLIVMERIGLSGDTLQVRIAHEKHLTQELGSTGADAYMAEATYNLTSCPGIRVVDFRFKRGDHATPGAYTRDEFRARGLP
jgi:hypothetical protein